MGALSLLYPKEVRSITPFLDLQTQVGWPEIAGHSCAEEPDVFSNAAAVHSNSKLKHRDISDHQSLSKYWAARERTVEIIEDNK